MIMGQTELLIKVVGADRQAVEGFAAYLKRDFEHAYPGQVRQNDRDEGWHIFVNITLEGSETAKITGRARP